jgi:hypothetical protein
MILKVTLRSKNETTIEMGVCSITFGLKVLHNRSHVEQFEGVLAISCPNLVEGP